jgi:hypothetical protein
VRRRSAPKRLPLTPADRIFWVWLRRVWLAKGYKSFLSARRTLEGIETMHMIRKGRVRRVARKDVVAEARFVAQLFGLAA